MIYEPKTTIKTRDVRQIHPSKWHAWESMGLVPKNVRRVVIDSGEPMGIPRIFFEVLADEAQQDIIEEFLMSPEIQVTTAQPKQD